MSWWEDQASWAFLNALKVRQRLTMMMVADCRARKQAGRALRLPDMDEQETRAYREELKVTYGRVGRARRRK